MVVRCVRARVGRRQAFFVVGRGDMMAITRASLALLLITLIGLTCCLAEDAAEVVNYYK